ncbi:iron-containing alcohol dehydrogenase [Bacteroidota bacterium]
MVTAFQLARTPHLSFGPGKLSELTALISKYPGNTLVITRGDTFLTSNPWDRLQDDFMEQNIKWFHETVDQEPSPDLIDSLTLKYADENIMSVAGIGGGSVLDAGKAVSAMLGKTESIMDYLEGVGAGKEHDGNKKPYIAVPTTSGTGAEATKNAVLSVVGERGFKKSLRHNNLVPDYAIIDPELTISCPQDITSASGMDAFTQLLESYLSPKASEYTDMIVEKGLKHVSESLEKAWNHGQDLNARSGMMLAAYYSGICLANAGLGVIHGFASSIGGMYDIPHGIICGTLMGPANRVTIRKLRKLENYEALYKYALAGKIFGGREQDQAMDYYINLLLDRINAWTEEFKLPGLAEYGIKKDHIPTIVKKSACRDNPVELEEEELIEILEERL